MSTLLRSTAIAACVAAIAGCQPPAPQPEPEPQPGPPIQDWRSLVGCYRAGHWSFALDSVPALAYWNPPPSGARQAWTYEERPGDLYWTITPEGYAEVVEHNGMYGGASRYGVKGDSLIGTRKPWTDIVLPSRPPLRIVAARVPCPGPPSADDPPPNPDQLELTFFRGLADVLRDSVMPRYRIHMLPLRPEASRITQLVSSILGARSFGDPETIYGMRIEVEGESLARNEIVADVAISVCKDQPEPVNLQVERVRYRFVRAPGEWRLVSTEPLGRTEGECGSHLPATPQP